MLIARACDCHWVSISVLPEEVIDHSTVPGSTSAGNHSAPPAQSPLCRDLDSSCHTLGLLLSLMTNEIYAQIILLQSNTPNPTSSPL